VIYEPLPHATPERQRRALAALYRNVIDRTQTREEEAASPTDSYRPSGKPEKERPAPRRHGPDPKPPK
jgi:hypothetical protein